MCVSSATILTPSSCDTLVLTARVDSHAVDHTET